MPGAQAVPQLGQLHAQRVSRFGGGVLPPAGHEQLIPGHGTAPVQDEVGEQDPAAAAGQRVFAAGAVDVGDVAPAQLDPGFRPLPHQATSGQRSFVPVVTARIRKGRGKATERSAQAAATTMVSSSSTAAAAQEESCNKGTPSPPALVTRPSTRGTSWP